MPQPATDLAGNNRTFNATGTATVDMGAYEYNSMYDVCTACLTNTSGIIYVNQAATTGMNNGKTWADAFTDLQDALGVANTCTNITEIWAAQGTYYPTTNSTDRTASFIMKNNLRILGGFVGGETTEGQRDWATNETILSGDIDGDNALAGNSYHVIFNHNNGLDDTAVLDGFSVISGNADGSSLNTRGGGMYNHSSSPTVSNCTFSGNSAISSGGGMYSSSSSPTVTNCTFSGNSADFGGGMYSAASSLTVSNCTFSGNTAVVGGGMYNSSSSPTVTSCTFSGNTASIGGGMYNSSSSSPTVTSCTFSENTASNNGGGIYNSSFSSPTVTSCTFSGNTAGNGAGMYNSASSSPTVTNCTFSGNSADFGGGMYSAASSLTVSNCTFSGNSAINSGGGMYNNSPPPSLTIVNSIFWNNGTEIANNNGSISSVTHSLIQGGYPGTGNLDQDPLFVDAANGDYTLQACSPAIDAGEDTVNNEPLDLVGNNRNIEASSSKPATIDMGAYEFQGTQPQPTADCKAPFTLNLTTTNSNQVTILPTDLNDNSTTTCGNLSFTTNPITLDFDCNDLGVQMITLRVTDTSNSFAECTVNVTIADDEIPTITCPIDQMVDANATCEFNLLDYTTMATNVMDNCNGAPTVTQLPMSNTTISGMTNEIILTADDGNGNTFPCTFNVAVVDNANPTAICQNLTIQLDIDGNASTSATAVDNGSLDNCGIASISLSQTDFVCTEVGTNMETLTVTDINGNMSTCPTTITVEDNVLPTAICQNITIQLDANGNATTSATAVDNGSLDNCGIASISLSQTDFVCTEVGTNTVTLTVTDVNTNSTTCTADVVIIDATLPIPICQPFNAALDANGIATVGLNDVLASASDNCGLMPGGQLTQSAFNCAELGDNTVTVSVTDVNGLTGSCQTIVTVVDLINPTAICQTTTIQLDVNGMASLTASVIDNGSNDNCGITNLTVAPNTFGCADVGSNTVTLTATDAAGNIDNCSMAILVESNVPPMAICNDLQVALDANGNVSVIGQDLGGSSTDACGIQSIALSQSSFDCSDLGQNTITVTVTNVNSNSSTCTSVLTVVDDIPATILCRAPLNIPTDPNACTALQNMLPPIILNENCSIISLLITNDAPVAFSIGTIVVTWDIVDAGGNLTQCQQNVTVNDLAVPTIDCPAGITIPAQNNCEVSASILGNATAMDNCGIATVTNDAPATFLVGNSTVIWTAVDDYGNSASCTQAISVLDNQVPIFGNCPTEMTLEVDAATCEAIVDWDDLNVTDNCGIAQISTNYATGASLPIGNYNIQISALDNNGNASNCTFNLTIADSTPPELTCPDNMEILSTDGQDVNVDFSIGMSDDCGVQILNLSHQSGDIFEIGMTTVSMTIADAGGNEVDCQFEIQVTPAVTVYCPADIEVSLDDDDDGQEIVAWNQPLVTTLCEDPFTKILDDLAYIGWHNGHRYYITQVSDTTWGIAEEMAIQMGGHLAIINNEAENSFLTEMMSTTLESAWIGLSDLYSVDSFTWVNGDSLTYQNWYDDTAPINNEVHDGVVLQNDGTWITDYAFATRQYIIEIPVFEVYVNGEFLNGNSDFEDSEDLFSLGTTTVDYLFVDECGYSNTCEFNVILEEETAEYCHAEGQILETEPYIESSVLNSTSFNNGINEGYADYTNSAVAMNQEDQLFFSFVPENGTAVHFWRVWIDWNADGDFYDDNEQVMETKSVGAISNVLNIPVAMIGQETRLRVALSRVDYPAPCGDLQAGEVEDYRLKINANPVVTGGGGTSSLLVYPNPTSGDVRMDFSKLLVNQPTVSIVNSLGQVLWQTKVNDSKISIITIPTADFEDGIYWVNIFDQGRTYSERVIVSKFVDYNRFK